MNIIQKKVEVEAGALPLRSCAGIMLLNRDGLVWVGRRKPKWASDHAAHIWQMPQGGIEPFEPPCIAALRELREETGVTNVEVLAEHASWLTYTLPEELVGIALKGRYRGQRQKWFAMRFLGHDSEVDLAPPGMKPEFDRWRWVPMAELLDLIVPFKRGVYEKVVAEFRPLAISRV